MERVVTGLVELDKKRYQVYLDEEFAFVLYKGEVRKYKIVVGKPLAQAAYQELVPGGFAETGKAACHESSDKTPLYGEKTPAKAGRRKVSGRYHRYCSLPM